MLFVESGDLVSGGKTFPKVGKLFPRQQSSTLFVSAFATSGRWHRAFANLNLGIVKVQQDLHIEPLSAAGTFPEMIGLGLCNAISIAAGLHSRTSYSNAAPSGSFSLNHSSAATGLANTLR